jgi:hypothetical protein
MSDHEVVVAHAKQQPDDGVLSGMQEWQQQVCCQRMQGPMHVSGAVHLMVHYATRKFTHSLASCAVHIVLVH